ncbi:hypothetical protein [Streptomyces genisteinicus]|uniref:DUF2256 domain-containing protein n=1 Tax=Streptomyces genisteinicus TaxID=2768068 RepID=A0A7H0HR40_9ACTN|nr:hypothetical protein [Streptomyces genisteinicus]QNP63006.1 hypothetical protein IAG43_08675 [Streptomyces genisteinicus]
MTTAVRTKPCRWCKRRLEQRRWWRPKRYCGHWHAAKYWTANLLDMI